MVVVVYANDRMRTFWPLQKGSFFNGGSNKEQKDTSKDIALTRLPSQPSWAAVLEKREPVLKPAEFFSTVS